MHKKTGFTLIEILIVIGILAILAAIVIIAINPAEQFAQARDAQRKSDVRAILNAVNQNMIRNTGNWTCPDGAGDNIDLPASAQVIGTDDGELPAELDICDCLVTSYLAQMPIDPTDGSWTDCDDYNTAYTIVVSASNDRITVAAPQAELETISVTR